MGSISQCVVMCVVVALCSAGPMKKKMAATTMMPATDSASMPTQTDSMQRNVEGKMNEKAMNGMNSKMDEMNSSMGTNMDGMNSSTSGHMDGMNSSIDGMMSDANATMGMTNGSMEDSINKMNSSMDSGMMSAMQDDMSMTNCTKKMEDGGKMDGMEDSDKKKADMEKTKPCKTAMGDTMTEENKDMPATTMIMAGMTGMGDTMSDEKKDTMPTTTSPVVNNRNRRNNRQRG